jgi:preprotein translocase subunit YajC
MLMVSDAFAQGLFGGGAPAAPGSSNPNMTFILQIAQFLPIIAIFYLLLIRPQQQQAKKLKAMLAALKNGDKVVTSGGLMGTIARLDEQKVTLRVADDVKMEFVKSAIVSVVTEGPQK